MAEDTKNFIDDLHATMSFQTFGTIWMKLIYDEFLIIHQYGVIISYLILNIFELIFEDPIIVYTNALISSYSVVLMYLLM